MKRRAMRVDKGLDADVESYLKEVHASSWSDASRQLIGELPLAFANGLLDSTTVATRRTQSTFGCGLTRCPQASMFGQSLPYKNIMQKEVYKCFHPPPFGRGLPAQKKVKGLTAYKREKRELKYA